MNKTLLILQRVLLAAVGSLPLLLLSYLLLRVWLQPASIGDGNWVRFAASIIMLEFLLLHSGAFMAAAPLVTERRSLQLSWFAGFGLVYSGALVGFASWTGASNVLWLLVSVMVSRLFTLLILRDKKGTIMMLQRSAMGMIVLIITAFILLIPLPEFGITEEVRLSVFGRPEDTFSKRPYHFIAWGVTYFFLMGLVESCVGWWLPDWSDEEADQAWEALKKSD